MPLLSGGGVCCIAVKAFLHTIGLIVSSLASVVGVSTSFAVSFGKTLHTYTKIARGQIFMNVYTPIIIFIMFHSLRIIRKYSKQVSMINLQQNLAIKLNKSFEVSVEHTPDTEF